MEAIFNFFVTSDWLLLSGTFIFLFLGYLFGKIFLLHKEDEEYENRRKQLQSQKALALADEEKMKEAAEIEELRQQQREQQPATETSPNAEPPITATLISLQLQIDEAQRSSDPHFFTSQIPLGPQVEQRSAAIDIRTLRKKFAELKMVIVMRRDLKPTESLAAGWGSTVALENVQHVRSACREPWLSWLRAWNAMAVAKVAVRVDSMEAMRHVVAAAVDVNARHRALIDAAKARRECREVAKKEKEEKKLKKQQQQKHEEEASKNNNGNDDDAGEDNSKAKSAKEIKDKKNKKTKKDDDDDDDDDGEEAETRIPDVSELFSLPISGLIMSEKPKPDETTNSSKKKSSSSSKGPSPQPKNKPLDISKMDFTVASSEELLKILAQIALGGESASAGNSCQIPCVAIGPCPVEFFEGVTDSLKLY